MSILEKVLFNYIYIYIDIKQKNAIYSSQITKDISM